MSMWPLIGVAIVVIGFVLRFNSLLVITVAAVATGVAGGDQFVDVISRLGTAYNDNRYMAVVWLVLPLIGLLERAGLRDQAHRMVAGIRGARPGRVLTAYLVMRQLTAALGLTSFGGHPQMVRPLVAPMAEAAASRQGILKKSQRCVIRAQAAAVDNIGAFFGEDIFIAVGSVLLMKGVLDQNGVVLAPLQFAVWAIPSAILALLVQGARLWMLDQRLGRELHAGNCQESTDVARAEQGGQS